MRRAFGLALIVLAGCGDPVADEQKRLDMVKASGSVEDVCRQSKAVADAALKAKSHQYAELNLIADVDCMTAEQHPDESWDRATNTSATPMEADNMEIGPVR